jgi:hypothetical protein
MANEGVAIRMMSERRCADNARLNLGHAFVVLAGILAAFSMLSLTGCTAGGSGALATPAGAIVGRSGYWNYSPSVIQTGDLQQFWWCGTGKNPSDSSQISDSILYESINTQTQQRTGPFVVLAETKGTWDALYTCNPRVIRGTFVNPLGDGQTYSYEMFYVGTVDDSGNAIGAAFSNDGIQWTKYPQPIILPTFSASYGVGQPAAYNADGKSAITLFYEDSAPTVHHVESTSTDGIHFTVQGTITTNGLDPLNQDPTWADMGYDPSTKYWYAAFNLPDRPPSTTGDIAERGQYGFQLYRIPNSSLLTGTTPWQMLKTIDTNLTGYESNFLPSLLHDMYGNINIGSYPKLDLFVSAALPQPAWDASPTSAGNAGEVHNWAIATNSYDPAEKKLALNRYVNSHTYETTTGWIDTAKFFPDGTIGHLYTTPQNGANEPFYGCKAGDTGYFVSLDANCAGQRILGVNGYGYAHQPAGFATVALYSCTSQSGRFLSQDPRCKGEGSGTLFAYALP